MINATNYLNLENVFVNELFGDVWLFLFVGLIIIWLGCMKAKTGIQVPSILTVVFIALLFSINYSEFLIFWIMALLAAGFMLYYNFSKILNR